MSTPAPSSPLDQALANVPGKFRKKLIDSYLEIKRGLIEAKFDSVGLNAGKFCEITIRLLQEEVFGKSTPFGEKIPNMADECRKLVTSPKASAVESVRAIIPRALIFIYTLRNKRGIGHVGGDVDANSIDAVTIARSSDWIICELIRVYHKLSLEEAQDIVDGLSVRQLPIIWEIAGKKRVLKDGFSAKQKVLLLLYSDTNSAVLTEDLCLWVEYSPSMFTTRVLSKLHSERLIEHDKENELVYLSPKGVKLVEDTLL
ncbi:MAG: hypothetical protein LPH21_06385 [Shewanella sp.]|nr:hypothetical protein [Shewanella sp.]